MVYRLGPLSLMTALIGIVLPCTADAVSVSTFNLICRYPVDYPPGADSLMLIPREVEIDRSRNTVSWNGAVTGVSANITNRKITFSFSEYKYVISRTTGEIRFFSPQGLESANAYRREMTQGLLRQGLSVEQAQADVEAALQNKMFAREHSGTCDLAFGAKDQVTIDGRFSR